MTESESKKNRPQVSIGLPVYNGEKYLREAVDSILAQSYRDFELIIADNASTDRTQNICLEYASKDHRIRYQRNERNLGSSMNHNLVFNMAVGEYFRWAGHDDIIDRGFLLKCVEVLDRDQDIVLCMPATIIIDESGRYSKEYTFEADASSPKPHQRFKDFVFKNKSGSYAYGLIRTQSMAQTALEGLFPSSDLVFLAELTLYGKFYLLPDRLFYRRFHMEQAHKKEGKDKRNNYLSNISNLSKKPMYPNWLYFGGLVKAIRNAPIPFDEKIRCYLILFYWAFLTRTIGSMVKDGMIAALVSFWRFATTLKKIWRAT